MKNQKLKNTMSNLVSGFTLIETLVAISILSLSVTAVFTAVQSGIGTSTYAKDQITAFYLAQEAMEFIRNVRDENVLRTLDGTPTHWLYRLASDGNDSCYFGKACIIDSSAPTVSTIIECFGGENNCPPIQQDPVSGLFGYRPGWTDTNFTRVITFEELRTFPTPNEVMVKVRITWVNHGITKNFIVSDNLFTR